MSKSIIELVIGDLGEKREYRQFMKRVDALPKDYRFAFKKIQHYLYNFSALGSDLTVFTDLLELFESSSAEGRPILEVIGDDVAAFSDELLSASTKNVISAREKLNKEIQDYFLKEEK